MAAVGCCSISSQGHVNAATLTNVRAIGNSNGIAIDTSAVYENGATVAPLISNTEVLNNSVDGFHFHAYGYFSSSSVRPALVHCTATNNVRHGLMLDGSAVSANGTAVTAYVTHSEFSDNQGDGVYATGSYQGGANLRMESSRLNHNQGHGFSWTQGANRGSTATVITNTIIADNQSGGVYLGDVNPYSGGGGNVRLVNTTLADNGCLWDLLGFWWRRCVAAGCQYHPVESQRR